MIPRPLGTGLLAAALLAAAFLAPPAAAFAPDCCTFTADIDLAVADLASDTKAAIETAAPPLPAARAAALLKALDKAREFLADVLAEGEPTCDNRAAAQKAAGAARWVAHYRETLADVGWDASLLDGDAALVIARIESLAAGVCEDGPALPLE